MAQPEPEIFKGSSKFAQVGNYLFNKYDFRMNRVSVALESKLKGQTEWSAMNDADLSCELFIEGYSGFKDHLSAIINSSFVKQFDPISEYFRGLSEWDKQTDYIGQLASFVQTTDQPFWEKMYRKMVVRAVAQSLNKIAFNKHCMVLFSTQNDGKTHFWQYHIPQALDDYAKKNIDFEGKDAKRDLASNFWVNLDELSGLSKQDVNRAKAFFSEENIKLRLPYGRTDSILKRRASFVGSTNQREFLVDETGNVRWLVFAVKSVNHDCGGPKGYQQVDINKVWAQAYFLLNDGFYFHLDAKDIAHSEKNNGRYGKETMEYQLCTKYFQESSQAEGAMFYQSTDILLRLQDLTGQKVRLTVESIGRAMHKMNVPKSQHNKPGQKFDVYGYWLKELHETEVLSLMPMKDGYLNSLNNAAGTLGTPPPKF